MSWPVASKVAASLVPPNGRPPASYSNVCRLPPGSVSEVSKPATGYTFNADGQLAMRGTDAFTYSTLGELISANVAGTAVTYQYDGFRRRTSRTQGVAVTYYHYANPRDMLQLSYTRNQAGVVTAYFYDDAGRLLGFQRGGATYHVATDFLGSPRIVTSSDGAVLRIIDYDEFGRVIADSDPTFELPIGYAGGISDPLTGFVLFGIRDYDPAAGRFTARDPIFMTSDHPNLYAYVGNDPISLKDPLGLFSIGFSGYSGFGGGVKLSITSQGISVCTEVGVGAGGGLTIAPNGKLDPPGVSVTASAAAKLAGVGGELETKIDSCGPSASGRVSVGPIEAKVDGEFSVTVSKDMADLGPKLELKAAASFCGGTSW